MAVDRTRDEPGLDSYNVTEVEEQSRSVQESPTDQPTKAYGGAHAQVATSQSAVNAQKLLDQVLDFLSTASNETLGACLAGLAAITYLLLGRVGLVLIGLLGGVVLHATWEEHIPSSENRTQSANVHSLGTRREAGLDILQRVLDWRDLSQGDKLHADQGVDDVKVKSAVHKQYDFSAYEPAVGAALTGLTDAVIRDYVKWWYGPLLPDDSSFPSACRQTFTGFLLSFSSHLSRRRPADVFLDFLTNSSSILIVFFNELNNALSASADSGLEAANAVEQYLEQDPASSLANVLDVGQQKRKLKDISEDILRSFLDPQAYACEPVRIFLRHILAGICFEMTIQTCSKPEWINGWIVYLLEEGTSESMNAIDTGVEDGAASVRDTATVDATKNSYISPASSASVESSSHQRTVSRAEEAMDEAMQEAKRLSEMIAAEEAQKAPVIEETASSGTTTRGEPTPTSSLSDLGALTTGSTSSLHGDDAQEPKVQPGSSTAVSTFTNFDQLFNSQPPTALQPGHTRTQSTIPPLTLLNASISIFDDAMPGENTTIRSKPTIDYLLQVEPATSQHPGWMIARKYADFETLHEVLKRISVVSGVPEFADRHVTIPGWKHRSKETLRTELEKYLRDALSFNQLAESEGMKRFLEKDQGLGRSSPSVKQGGFGFPTPAAFESMGKGMLDVLAAAPKGAAGGGKAILGGMTGVLGGVGSLGQKKPTSMGSNKSAQSSNVNLNRTESHKPWTSNAIPGRMSYDVPRGSFGELDRSTSKTGADGKENLTPDIIAPISSLDGTFHSVDLPRNSISSETAAVDMSDEQGLGLPPPPSEIPDDWSTTPALPRKFTSANAPMHSSPEQPNAPTASSTPSRPPPTPLTEPETRMAIELFFATITSLYTLSPSIWSIRRTLLTAAKNYLLRPGNPNLEAIRQLVQSTLIEASTSDTGLSTHIHKIRQNALPTEAELKAWPPPMGEEEKEGLRRRARKLLMEKGMPAALTGVMGQAASGEALGRVFDAVQVERVARGVVGGLVLQGTNHGKPAPPPIMSTILPTAAKRFKLIFYVPEPFLQSCKSAIFTAGAGRYPGPGNYTECCWTALGTGQFRPGDTANPSIGTVGGLEEVREARVETLCVGEEVARRAVEALKG
ncbi:MAG: hypothetical protein Q9203_001093 [Teloschistes exilis]